MKWVFWLYAGHHIELPHISHRNCFTTWVKKKLSPTTSFQSISPVMDMPPAWSQACMCGQMFSVPNTYTYHMHTCPQMKKQLSSALGKAREVFQAKKCRKMEDVIQQEASEASNHPVVNESSLTKVLLPIYQQVWLLLQPTGVSYAVHQIPKTTSAESHDLNQPIAEQRMQRQNRQLPKCYRDIAPEPPTTLLLASSQVVSDCPLVNPEVFTAHPSC